MSYVQLKNHKQNMQLSPSPHLRCETSPCFQKQREELIYTMLTKRNLLASLVVLLDKLI